MKEVFKLIDSRSELLNILSQSTYDAIVVEGYDGVGKGCLLNYLSEVYGVIPYRPDYNLWQMFDHRPSDRWKVSGFFWDICSHFNLTSESPMLFDRGVISGAVYNHDHTISDNYKTMLRDKKVMHILVCCDEEDFFEFYKRRNIEESDIEDEWLKYLEYTEEYLECFETSGVEYIIYHNKLDPSMRTTSTTCEGCGHYNYGWCRHPLINSEVGRDSKRCKLSKDKEVQDIVTKM